jgi:class 3 adenylate cyclase
MSQRTEPLAVMFADIGFHYGEVACEAGLVCGDAVNAAARVAAMARADQIWWNS